MSETVRCWLVERGYDDRGVVTLVYATADGTRAFRRDLAAPALRRTGGVTAARPVEPSRLAPVEEPSRRERYAREAERMAARHDPDDHV